MTSQFIVWEPGNCTRYACAVAEASVALGLGRSAASITLSTKSDLIIRSSFRLTGTETLSSNPAVVKG